MTRTESRSFAEKLDLLKKQKFEHSDFETIEEVNRFMIDNNIIESLDLNESTLDTCLGYEYIYKPTHPLANKSGKVYTHRYQMCKKLNRYISSDEHVHHIDENRRNNTYSNLELLSHSAHAVLHAAERLSGIDIASMFYAKKNLVCMQCAKEYFAKNLHTKNYCSAECSENSKRKFDPSREELEKLVWQMPTTKVAKLFGVSDKAINKRCEKLDIPKPPRGYWTKLEAGKIDSV